MSFSKYISQTPQDFGQALQVSGFIVSNGSPKAPYTENLQRGSNDLFTGGSGIPVGTLVSSGQFHGNDPYISWDLSNPTQNKVYNDYDIPDLNFFSGFDIVLRDETGLLVQTLETGYYENYYEIDIENLKTQFSLESGRDERRFRFEVVANDYYNRTHTGVFFLTCERPDVTGLDVSIGKSIKFKPEFSKASGIDSLVLCVGTGSDFDVFSTGAENSAVAYQDINVKGQTLGNFQQNYDAGLESSYYYGFYAVDVYGTGSTYIYPSSIKPLEIDPLKYNIKPSGFRGKIVVERDPINRNINSYYKGVVNKDFTLEKVNYEVFVFQSGREDLESSFSVESQSISNVNFLVHGSGQNRIDYNFFTGDNFRGQDYYYSGSNSEPVFSTYNTTGIQWKEHTILLDNQSALPGGSYTGQSPVKEIAIAAGNTNSNKIYLGVQINSDNKEFYFYPEGGYFNSGIYTGTYAENITGGYYTYENYGPSGPSGPTGPTGPTGPASSGYAVLLAGVTGSLMATNLSGFISTNYEPNFTYDISADTDYYFKVRPIDNDGNKGTFTDLTYVSSGDIVSAISGAGYSTGLFNGDTNSGLAFYNADLDVLNVSDNLFSSGSGLGVNISTPEHHFHVSGDAQISGYLYDSQNTTGEAGYFLASEEGGPQWKQIEDVLSGIGGSGATNYVARWADEDTLTTGVLVDNGTNVGINVPSPNYPLEISSSGNATIRIEDTTNTSRLDLRAEDSAVLIRSTSNFPMRFDVNQTERMRIDTAGKVGIGTASPSSKLQVVGSTSGDSVLKVDGTNGTLFEVVDDLSDSLMSVNDAAGLPVFEVFADNTIIGGRYNQNDFYLDTNGNLGLGTSAPSSVLDIYEQSGKDNKLRFHSSTTGSGTSNGSRIGLNGAELFINNQENAAIKIYTQSTQTNGITILGNGNVGIGTASPDAKLEILSDGSAAGGAEIRLTHANDNANDVISTLNFANNIGSVAMIQGGTTGANNTGYISFFTDNAGTSSEKVRIIGDGNIGIGTTVPNAGLHVVNSTEPTVLFESTNAGSSGSRLQLYHNSATPADNDIISNIQMAGEDSSGAKRYAALIQTIAADVNASSVDGDIRFLTYKLNTASEVMRITHDKTVGVGIVPLAKFEVDLNQTSGTLVADNYAHFGGQHMSNGSVMGITLGYREANLLYRKVGIVARGLGDIHARQDLDFLVSTATGSASVTPSDAKLTISGLTGNVGIGNTNPQGTLDLGNATGGKSIVWGGANGTNHYTSIWSEYGSGSLILAGGLKSSTTDSNFIYPYTGTYGYAAIELDSFHDDGIKFYTAADASRTAGAVATKQERMRIDTSGNVGIGTISPTGGKLQVAGKVRIDAGTGNDALNLNAYDLLKWDNSSHIHFGGYKTGQWTVLKFYSSSTERLNISGDVNVQGATDLNINGPSRRLSFTSGTGTIRTTTSNNLILQTDSISAITIYPTQQVQFNAYGSGTFTGTATQRLAVDSSGNIIEIPIGSGAVDGSGAANKVTYWTNTDTISYNNNFHWDNTNGNLGVGTATPSSTLHVSDSTSGSSVLKVDGTSGTIFEVTDDLSSSLMSVNTIAGLPVFEVFADNHIVAGRHNQNDFYLNTSGNLGLGTSSPITKLNIKGDQSVDGQLYIEPTNDGEYAGLVIKTTRGADRAYAIFAGGTGTDDLNFRFRDASAGVDRMVIDSSGNVGIGANNPSAKLHIFSGTDTTPQFKMFGANADGIRISMGVDDADDVASIYAWDENDGAGAAFADLNLGVSHNSAQNGIFISGSTQNVGIGTDSPSTKLHVYGADPVLTIQDSESTVANASAILRIGESNGSAGLNNNFAIKFVGTASGGDLDLSRYNNTTIANQGLRIRHDGNVGIGTVSPVYKLDLYDATDSASKIGFHNATTGTTVSDGTRIGLNQKELFINNQENAAIKIYTQSTQANGITILGGGDVGVGTTSPSEKLDVVGNVKHQGLTMTSGTDIDQLKTFTQTLTITTNWQDTGIDGSDLTTGTYIVQLLGDDDEVGGSYSVYYSGTISWYSSGTNDADFTSEIALHRAGHADAERTLYLRISTNSSGGNDLELQIAGNYNATGSDSYVFKFRRMI